MNVSTWVMADGSVWRDTLLDRRAVRIDTTPDERVLPLGTAYKAKHTFTRLWWAEGPPAVLPEAIPALPPAPPVRAGLSQPKTGPEPLATAALLPWHPPKEPPPVKTAPPRPAPPKAKETPPDHQGSLFG